MPDNLEILADNVAQVGPAPQRNINHIRNEPIGMNPMGQFKRVVPDLVVGKKFLIHPETLHDNSRNGNLSFKTGAFHFLPCPDEVEP